MTKKQYFIGVLPNSDQQGIITNIKTHFKNEYGSKAALKSPPHITLVPPFHWSEHEEQQLIDVLMNFCSLIFPFCIKLKGFGSFPPKVIYIKVLPNPNLEGFHDRILEELYEKLTIVNKERKGRKFTPHVTVAFSDLVPSMFRKAQKEFLTKDVDMEFEARAIALLKHNGKKWEVLLDIPFSIS